MGAWTERCALRAELERDDLLTRHELETAERLDGVSAGPQASV